MNTVKTKTILRQRWTRPHAVALRRVTRSVFAGAGAVVARVAMLLAISVEPAAALDGELQIPVAALAGEDTPVKLVFREGARLSTERIAFQLVVTGRARFATVAREGTLLFGGGSPVIGGETDSGLFEIDLSTPAIERLEFLFQETSATGLSSVQRVLFGDALEGERSRLWGSSVSEGAPQAWRFVDLDPDGTLGHGWWSGPHSAARDSALLTPFIELPAREGSTLRFRHRLPLASRGCSMDDSVRLGARVEVLAAGGVWEAVTPVEGYSADFATPCATPLAEERVYGPLAEFSESVVDLDAFIGESVRVRWRHVTDCETCDDEDGWRLYDVRVLSDLLVLNVIDPREDDDGDGLSNREEVERETDPLSADTDEDGLSDGVETATGTFVDENDTGTDPLVHDTDRGGVSDGDEVRLGYDPLDPTEEPAVTPFDLVLPAGGVRQWIVRGDGTAVEASQDPQEGVFAGAGGFQLRVASVRFPPFSGALRSPGEAPVYTVGPATAGPFRVSRSIFVSDETGVLRYTETIENTSGRDQTATVRLRCELAQPEWAEIESTSSGDTDWRDDDHRGCGRRSSSSELESVGVRGAGPTRGLRDRSDHRRRLPRANRADAVGGGGHSWVHPRRRRPRWRHPDHGRFSHPRLPLRHRHRTELSGRR